MKKPEELYKKEVKVRYIGPFTTGTRANPLARFKRTPQQVSGVEHVDTWADNPLLMAFWNDNQIQEITITSSNMGFAYTYIKQPL